MQGKTLLKIAIIAVAVVVIWKKGIPWWNEHHQPGGGSTSTSSPGDACAAAAAAASEAWGSGIGKFANPPYDLTAWDEFRSRVDQSTREATNKCSCAADSCTTARTAMSDLRNLVGEMDGSIRSGSPPPSDAVQRQESIDNAINSARDLAHQGR
jgi:hypothetical protein